MNNQEAKFILGAYRAGGQDSADPALAEALQRAKTDPELEAWFTRARAHDTAVAGKLREVAPPPGLREAILAGARAGATPRAWWTRPQVWAIAASVAILLTILGLRAVDTNNVDPRTAALAGFAINDSGTPGHHGTGAPQGALRTWLTTSGSKLTSGQTLDFAQLKANGCRTLRFADHDVVEVCFERDGLAFHLYAVPRDAMPEMPNRAQPALIAHSGRAAAVWSDNKFHYVVATAAGVNALKLLL